jgi:methyl-accepting chemotaxis protein
LIFLLGIVLIVFAQSTLFTKLKTELQKDAIHIAKAIAMESIDHILTRRTLDLHLLLFDHKNLDNRIEYVFILDRDNKVIAHTFIKGFPVDLKDANILKPGEQYNIQPLITEKGHIIDIAVPILKGKLGSVRLGISEKPIIESLNNLIRLLILALFVVLAIGGIIAIIYANALTKPITELTRAAEAVGSGNLELSISVKTKDEIGKLTSSFNTMIEKLKNAKKELEMEIAERKNTEKNLRAKMEELESFYQMAVSRELKMKELKKEIERLKAESLKHKKDK